MTSSLNRKSQSIVSIPSGGIGMFRDLCAQCQRRVISGLRMIDDYGTFTELSDHEHYARMETLELIVTRLLGVRVTFTGIPDRGILRINQIAPCTEDCFRSDGPDGDGDGAARAVLMTATPAIRAEADQAYLWVTREGCAPEPTVTLTLVGNDPIVDTGLSVEFPALPDSTPTYVVISEILLADEVGCLENVAMPGTARACGKFGRWCAANSNQPCC
ncbi:MAG: hypothetical protein AAFY84_03145 [Pseudomonadota bacterium]